MTSPWWKERLQVESGKHLLHRRQLASEVESIIEPLRARSSFNVEGHLHGE